MYVLLIVWYVCLHASMHGGQLFEASNRLETVRGYMAILSPALMSHVPPFFRALSSGVAGDWYEGTKSQQLEVGGINYIK